MIVDSEWSALDPSIMGLGPVLCATALLRRHGLALGDIDLWEINEAFAAQVLACLRAWEDDDFCRDVLGLDGAAGRIDRDKLNVDGGAIGLGHPGRRERQPHRAASGQRDETARHQARHRHRMHRRRAGRRHADRGGVGARMGKVSTSRSATARARTLSAASSNSARSAIASTPWRRSWRALAAWQRDADGVAWLVLDKEGASANTLSRRDVLAELNEVLDAHRARAAARAWCCAPAKTSGFIAGADIGEFRGMTDAATVEARLRAGARRPRSRSTG